MTLNINSKEPHILKAEKMAEAVFSESPVNQQQMKETFDRRLIELNTEHLQILKK